MKILDKTTQTYKELVLKPGGDTLPIGGIIAFDSDTIPNGWLLCDGRAVSRTEYAELFKAIGTKHGSGDGSTTFNLPNPKGRTLVGKDSTDTDFNTLGKTGGEKTHTLTVNEMPSHDHTLKQRFLMWDSGDSYEIMNGDNTWSGNIQYNAYDSDNYITRNTGGGQPHNNLQPYIVTNYIIKAKNTAIIKGEVIQETGTASETNVYSSVAVDNKIKTNIVTGEEVATNEYIDGKQVFVKRVEFTLPTTLNAWTTLIQLDSTVDDLIDRKLRYYSGGENYDFPYNFENEEIICYFNKNNKTLNFKTNFSYPGGKPGWGILKYTKN